MSETTRFVCGVALSLTLGVTGGCAPTDERGAAAQSLDDGVINARVQAALRTQSLDVSDVQVNTSRGVVRLTGFAWDRQSADAAEATARRIAGVVDVTNEIVLRGGGRQGF
jgi:osmotically-inducible protein OsmY